MKKFGVLFLLFFAILFSQNIVAQNTSSIDERLYAVFDADYLQKLEKTFIIYMALFVLQMKL